MGVKCQIRSHSAVCLMIYAAPQEAGLSEEEDKWLKYLQNTRLGNNKNTSFFFPRQAQLRVHESSQKLQLLRHSLEKCLQENNQRPSLQPAGPTDVSGDLPSPGGFGPGRPWLSDSPSFPSLRPASLTGTAAPHHVRTGLLFFSALLLK